MNEFQQYQQQLQMQRMMEMQQARMQQLQQQQNNMMLFGQQRAYMGSLVNPLGGSPLSGGAVGMGLVAGGGTRQSLLGAALDAGRFNFAGIGTSEGLFGLGIGNRVGFRFADANRSITQARAQDALAGFGTGFTTGLLPGIADSLGLGFINRRLGTQGLVNINDRTADVMDAFQGLRGPVASGVEGRGLSREFATRALITGSRRLGSAMPELSGQEIRDIQGVAMETMSTAQLTQAARSESDFDKMMESQEALLKKIAENTKMSVDEIKETNKVFKGQGGVGGSMQAMETISAAVAGMAATTDVGQRELMAMGAGFRRGAIGLGLRDLDAAGSDMMARVDARLRQFQRGGISEVVFGAFGGSSDTERAANLERALLQSRANFATSTMGTLGLLADPGRALREGGVAGAAMGIGAAVAANPVNAQAEARFTDAGRRRFQANTASAMRTMVDQARANAAVVGGNRAYQISEFQRLSGLPDEVAMKMFADVEANEGLLQNLGEGGQYLTMENIAEIERVGAKTGLGNRAQQVADLLKTGQASNFEDALRQAYTPQGADEVRKMARAGNALGQLVPGDVRGYTIDESNLDPYDLTYQGPTVSEFLGPDTTENTINRTSGYQAGVRQLGNQYLDAALRGVRVANEERPAMGTTANPMVVVPAPGVTFGETVGND